MFLKAFAIDSGIFFEIKELCKLSCVRIFLFPVVAQKGTNILIFYIFEYGTECSAESGAKYYFTEFC